jgi:hypothetical protein
VANLFTNIRSWYPSNTTCLYKFTAHDTKDLISLEFLWFRIERVTLCQESVRLFDGREPDMSTLMTRLCDMNRPQVIIKFLIILPIFTLFLVYTIFTFYRLLLLFIVLK